MTLEKEIQLGKTVSLVGLDFSFGYIKLLPEFGYELSDIDKFFKGEGDAFDFLCAVLMATNKNYHELNEEGAPVLSNKSRASVALLEFDTTTIGEYLVRSMESFVSKLEPKGNTQDDKKKSKIRPSLK